LRNEARGVGFGFAGDVAGAALGFGHGVIPFVGKMPRRPCEAEGVRARGQHHLSDYWEARTKSRVGGGSLSG
jgi:hypothetical protein